MTRARWLVAALVGTALVAAATVAIIVLRLPQEKMTAQDFAGLAAVDLAGTRERFLYKRLRLEGTIALVMPVDGDGEPFTMIDLENGQGFEFQAAFATRDAAALEPGSVIVFEGECKLCDGKSILFDQCVLISQTAQGK